MAQRPGRRRLRHLRRRALHAAGRARRRARRRGQPRVPARRLPADDRRRARRAARSPRRSAAARASAGTSTTTTCSRAASASSARATARTSCSRGSRRSTASRPSSPTARGWPTSAAATAPRRMLMAEAFPRSEFVGFDYHDARSRSRAAREADARRSRFEVASAAGVPGQRVRPGHDVRLPARHGRPRGAARHIRETLGRRRHVADRRAVRRRQRGGQPEPGRARLLRGLDAGLHARLAVAGRRARARRPGGRGAAARRGRRGGLHPLPPRRRDAVQPRPRSRGHDRPAHRAAGAREQSRARYPDRGGLRRARRRPDLLRGLRRRRPDDPAAPDVVDRPLAPLEGADPVPGAALPRRHVRRSRQRQVGPPARRRRLRRAPSSRPTRSPCMDATGTERAVLVGLSRGATGRPRSRPTTRSGCSAASTSVRRSRSRPAHPERAIVARFEEELDVDDRLGEVQPPLLAAGLPRLPRVLLRADVQRAALDQADRGLRRLGARDRPGDARGHDLGAGLCGREEFRGHRGAHHAARCS